MRVKREAPSAGAFTKFRLLMWKNFLHQWRHPIKTAIEILLPVGTMALVLILRSQIEPSTQDILRYPPIPAYSLNHSRPVLLRMNYNKISIAYSPESPILDDVIRNAAVNLIAENIDVILSILQQIPGLPDLPTIPPDLNTTQILDVLKYFINVQSFNNSAGLNNIYRKEEYTREVLATVEFNDDLAGAISLPDDLSYALRFPERPRLNSFFGTGGRSWRTNNIFPFFQLPGPRFPRSWEGGNDPGYVNEIFLALQHSISMEIISRQTNMDLKNFTVNIQRYPHPAFVQDLAVELLTFIFPLFVMISFSYTSVNIVSAVTTEKENQLKEMMKIMGLPTWLHWTAWFLKQFIYTFLISSLIVVLLKVNWFTNEEGFNDYAVFTNTSWSVLLFFFTLYLTCMIFFGFMLSGFFSKANTASLFAGVIWFLTYLPAFLLSMDTEVPLIVQVLTCLSINSAMSYGFQLILSQESLDGMSWGNFFPTHASDANRLLFGHVVIILAIDCVLYMLVALYLEQVLPGTWGTPKPWYFIFQKSFWCSSAIASSEMNDVLDSNTCVRESEPRGLEIGVKMTNLTKVYGSDIVVNNVNLNIYDDQITVLLGHNGAGKSTTISMLTGNVEITKGSVWLAGYDMSSQTESARTQLGLCPQHNVLFNDLTVYEHLKFYAKLKGLSGKELDDEINTLIEKLEMTEKRDYKSQGLSGGQKRRLCVGIALCGGARVVLLDEPTSGMDPASRRALWSLLEKEKKGRSMILTTHFMDEADYLGDRVAILSNGSLQCVGSPYFLKTHYGVGYTLVVVKDDGFDLDACTNVICKYVPDTLPKDNDVSEISYSLPNTHRHIFEVLLNDMENNIDTIKFKNYGLVATTLEDVFMSVGSDMEIHSESDRMTTLTDTWDESKANSDATSLENLSNGHTNETGTRLLMLHVQAIWMKLFLVWSRSWGILLLQILVPLLQINLSLGLATYIMRDVNVIVSRILSLTEGYISTDTFLSYNGSNPLSVGAAAKIGYEYLFRSAEIDSMKLFDLGGAAVDDYYLNRTADPVAMSSLRNRVLIGATFDDYSATTWFSNFGYHDVATSLATAHAAILKGYNPAAHLTVYNHPLQATYNDTTNLELMISLMSMQVATSIGNCLSIASAVFIMFYIKERVVGAKLLQKAAGVRPVVMWVTSAVFDWAWFLVISLIVVASCAAFSVVGLRTFSEIGRLYLCLMVYGAAMLPLHYLFSLLFKKPAVGFVVMFFVNVLFGLMGAQIVETLSMATPDTKEVAVIMDYVLQFFPLYSLVTSVRSLNRLGMTVYSCMQYCDVIEETAPDLGECSMDFLCNTLNLTNCCVRENAYFEWESPGILRYILCMIVAFIAFWSIFLLLENNLIQRWLIRTRTPPPVAESSLDPDVVDEAVHAQRADISSSSYTVVTRSLSKYYGKNLAVNQISFTVGEAECFGLLGVNGAGKTTIFKMLMGDETISSGDAYVCGHSIKRDLNKVYENIGYCPQFDALFSELTGRETLRLYAMFRGLTSAYASAKSEMLAHSLGFTKHLDKRVDQYSGGNKRKLSTAVSLMNRARLVFVDEPTTGIDPAAKRQVWRALRAQRKANTSFVLTSHSMEECDALCSRLTVMVNGRFECLGTPQHLKNKLSQGFTLTIKAKLNENELQDATNRNNIETIKDYVIRNFNAPRLMEQYSGVLTYYLPDRSVVWSKMFGIMERAKLELPVEDYSILQTTLEQIFLQFTKHRHNTNITSL